MESEAVIRLPYGLEMDVQHRDFFASLSNAAINEELPESRVDKQIQKISNRKRPIILDSTWDRTSQLHRPMTSGCNFVTFAEPVRQS